MENFQTVFHYDYMQENVELILFGGVKMDFIILSLFFLMIILIVLGLSYLDICFRSLADKIIIINNCTMLNKAEYKRQQGKYNLILATILLLGILISYLVKVEAISVPFLDYWAMILVIFSIVYGRSSRKYLHSRYLKRK